MRRPRSLAAFPLLVLALLLALAPGCKSMGGIASGLGKVAGGVARGVSKAGPVIARGVAKAGPTISRGASAVARGVVRTAPAALQVAQATAQAAIESTMVPEFTWDISTDAQAGVHDSDVVDPCDVCPLDADCGACVGYAGYACVAAPVGVLARCTSSAPPDAPPAAAPDPYPDPDDPAAASSGAPPS
jgi:hypothetical protein